MELTKQYSFVEHTVLEGGIAFCRDESTQLSPSSFKVRVHSSVQLGLVIVQCKPLSFAFSQSKCKVIESNHQR